MYNWNTGTPAWNATATVHRKFIYDGWRIVMELDGLNDDAVIRTYTWGLDLSGQNGGLTSGRSGLDGAGGIGGLLALQDTRGTGPQVNDYKYIYFYDANGNVGQLADIRATTWSADVLTAKYEYSPFGKLLSSTGTYADANPFRFSTKYFDVETGLSYFGYRYYNAQLGRWVNRDPIGEVGGPNEYLYVRNQVMVAVDPFGLWKWKDGKRQGGARAIMLSEAGDSTETAAQFAKLEPSESALWLRDETSGKWIPPGTEIRCAECPFSVPNTVYITKGDVSAATWKRWMKWDWWSFNNVYVSWTISGYRKELENRGYMVVYDNYATSADIRGYLGQQDIHGWFFGGHGVEGILWCAGGGNGQLDGLAAFDANRALHHRLGFVTLYACEAARDVGWRNLVSRYGILRASAKKIRPAFTDWHDIPIVCPAK